MAYILPPMPSDMRPFLKTFGLLAVGLAWAQAPWTNWNVYRDSTGGGQSPVTGQAVCTSDTFWLIVDTTGMGSAGITGWNWSFSGPTPQLVYCQGSGCPSTLPDYFPYPGGIDTKVILGVRHMFGGATMAYMLKVYYANGDSAIVSKSFVLKGTPNGNINAPSSACAGSSVLINVQLPASYPVDSFKVTDGSTTIANQQSFYWTMPSGSGSLTLTLTVYNCGSTYTHNHVINYFAMAPSSGPTISVNNPLGSPCPTSARMLFPANSLPPGYTSFVWKVNGNSIDPNSTLHPQNMQWNPPGPGSYTISYEATYPCGTVSNTLNYTINPASTPSWQSVYAPPSYCLGTSALLQAWAGPGLYNWDIGNDGSIEAINSGIYSGTFSSVPVTIKVSYNNGCGGTLDTVFTWNPTSGSVSGAATINYSNSIPICASSALPVSLRVYDFPVDSIRNVEWSWDNVTWSASAGLDTTLTVPAGAGPWTLYCRFTANSPAACLTPPSSPVSLSVSASPASVSFTQVGYPCTNSGGTIKLVPSTSADSLHYYLPNGTILARGPNDTLTLSIPSGTSSYVLNVKAFSTCGVVWGSYGVQFNPSLVLMHNPSPVTICAGIPTASISGNFSGGIPDSIVLYLGSQRAYADVFSSSFSFDGDIAVPSTPGLYPVTIVAYSCGGNDTVITTLQVISSTNAKAFFTAPKSGCVGQPIQFVRPSGSQGLLSATWAFGDGTFLTDAAATLTHIYSQPGVYFVFHNLQSIDCGSSQHSQAIRIYATAPTISGLTVTPSGLTITYSASVTDYDTVYWTFGDGNQAGGLSGTHTYAATGSYTITVYAINGCDTTTQSQSLVVSGLGLASPATWVLYPNPTRSELYIGAAQPEPATLTIFDLTGRAVYSGSLTNYPARVTLSLPAGLYSAQIRSATTTFTTRLVIE